MDTQIRALYSQYEIEAEELRNNLEQLKLKEQVVKGNCKRMSLMRKVSPVMKANRRKRERSPR